MAESTGQPGTAKERPPFGGLPSAIVTPGPSEQEAMGADMMSRHRLDVANRDAVMNFPAVVAAAHNPVLSGLFTEFTPGLQEKLLDRVGLVGLRAHDPVPGDAGHTALVEAVIRGDAEAAGRALREELEQTLTLLKSHLSG